jgi:hypothetical protein
VRCRCSGVSILSGDCRNLGRSERLRLTQRVADVRGLEYALSLESNPKTFLGTAAGPRGSSAGERCGSFCGRPASSRAAGGSLAHARAHTDLGESALPLFFRNDLPILSLSLPREPNADMHPRSLLGDSLMRFHVRWTHMRPMFLSLGLALMAIAGSAGVRWH